jgi:hypothetical protein
VIGASPTNLEEIDVETWSMNWRKSPMKTDVVELDGVQLWRLAETGGGDFGSKPAKTRTE